MPASEDKSSSTSVSKSTSSTSATHENSALLPYVCVHCSTPCAALYRQLNASSASSIKAMTCQNCGKVVDPYTEQEPLLVAIDCILSRVEAYRHVLYNSDELKNLPPQTIVQLLFGWCVVEAFLKWQATNTDPLNATDTYQERQNILNDLAPFALSSLLGMLFQWYVTQAVQTNPTGSRIKLFWAVFLPCCFTGVTVFVSIWENTKAVRMLGTLLTSYWQGTATWIITKDILTPAICLSAGIVWRLLLPLLFPASFACLGYELNLFNYGLCVTT